MSNVFYQHNQSIPWQKVAPGIQRQLFGHNDSIMMAKVKFEKGAVGALHDHPHVQVSYVESGVFELEIDGTTQQLQAGDGFFVPPGKVHGCKCIEAGILVDVYNPTRADFLP